MKRVHFLAVLLAAATILPAALTPVRAASPDPSVGDVIRALQVAPTHTRGSRPVQSGAASAGRPQAGAAASHVPGQPVAGSGAIDLNVQFATGTATLTDAARHTLDVLGQALGSPELAQARVRIEGHTDTVGSSEYNLDLSWRRATAAASYLQEKFNIPASRLEAVGRGEAELLIPTGNNVDEPRNRRVHVVNISG